MNIKFYSTIFTKGIGIALIATINTFSTFPAFGQQANCSNYWINPNTGKTECFNSNMNLIVEPKPLSHKPLLAESYDIGGKKITIPVPNGYVRVTEEMDAVYRLHHFSMQTVDPKSDLLASYIPESNAPIAREGDLPHNERMCAVLVNKSIKRQLMSYQDFAEFKSIIKFVNKEALKSFMPEVQVRMDKTSQEISKEFGNDFAFEMSQLIPLDPHYESDNALSYSMYMTGVSAGSSEEESVYATYTLVNVSGKVFFLSCAGNQHDLEWTRNTSRAWLDKVTASNRALN